MAKLSKIIPLEKSLETIKLHSLQDDDLNYAPSRLHGHGPISIIDIGSNSVRLVVYERLSRSPHPLFNEKAVCGLGHGVAETGRLDEDAMDAAIAAIHRFKAVSDQLGAVELIVLATAAAREASNGDEFIERVSEISQTEPRLLSGEDEALYSAYGILSGIYDANGIMGDMGGGSLEISDICDDLIGGRESFPLGALRLKDLSEDKDDCGKQAYKISKKHLKDNALLKGGKKRVFYAIGGTWRSLAYLHMEQNDYPLHVVHHYTLSAKEMERFCEDILETPLEDISSINTVSKNRAPLIHYGAALLLAVIEEMEPKAIVMSALGVREGVLFEALSEEERSYDGLLAGAADLSLLRARSPLNARELCDWTQKLMRVVGLDEDENQRRLREAACLLNDLGWRAHPDYRGEQSLNTIAHAAFISVTHEERAFIALACFFRHEGQLSDSKLPALSKLLKEDDMRLRARLLGLSFRLGHLISASMPGTLSKTMFILEDGKLIFEMDESLAAHIGERVLKRLNQMEKLLNIETTLLLADWEE